MLNTELRIKTGLIYGASSHLRRFSRPGSVALVSFAKTESTIEAVDRALAVGARFRASGLGPAALVSAKNYVLGQFPADLETASQLAAQLSLLELHALDPGYVNDYGAQIQAVDGASIDKVIAGVYGSLDDLVFMFIGDAGLIREKVAKYGPLTEMSISALAFHP